jgi:hypothetical protein
MHDLIETVACAVADGGQTPSAEAWFAGGERIGYDPRSGAIVASEDAPPQDFPTPGGGACARRFLPAWISRRLIRVGEGSIVFAELDRDAEALPRLCWHGRQRQAQRLRLFDLRTR